MSLCGRLWASTDSVTDEEIAIECDRVLVTVDALAWALHDGCALTGDRHELVDCPNRLAVDHNAATLVDKVRRHGRHEA